MLFPKFVKPLTHMPKKFVKLLTYMPRKFVKLLTYMPKKCIVPTMCSKFPETLGLYAKKCMTFCFCPGP